MSGLIDLNGKVAVVTGASSGLGADAARAYVQAGAKVALLGRRIEKISALQTELEAAGGQALAVGCDVTDENSVKNAVTQILDHYNVIDILLNCAGVAVRGGVETLSVEDWDKSFNTNVKGLFLMSKYVVPGMKEHRYGRIVNVASVNALLGNKSDEFIRHSYNASKAAVLGLTTGMAASYARYNITVNALGPALFESEMTANTLFKSEQFLQEYSHVTPAGRPGNPGELNGLILFLSSDACSYVHGQFMLVDGGLSLV